MLGKIAVLTALTAGAMAALVMWLHNSPEAVRQLAAIIPQLTPFATLLHNAFSSLSTQPQDNQKKGGTPLLFTSEQLSRFTGHDGGEGPYLSLLGKVYDVSHGMKHYGPGGHYSGLAGRDASRSFVSGDFSEEALTDDVDGLNPADYLALQDWAAFYEKDYVYIGKLIGRYYDSTGAETEYRRKVRGFIKSARHKKADEEQEKQRFPPCNIEWSQDTGRRFWCTRLSGGVQRDWEGVPRRMYLTGKKDPNCVCVNKPDLADPRFKHYPDCEPDSVSCSLKE